MIEEYVARIQQLKNGKEIDIVELLKTTREQYRQTRRLFNLGVKRKNSSKPRQLALSRQPPRRTSKYSADELVWIIEHKSKEIADRFGITVKQAYAVKHYARSQYLR